MRKRDEQILLILSEGPCKRNKLLFLLGKAGFSITDDQLRRSLDKLYQEECIRRARKGVYITTEKGEYRARQVLTQQSFSPPGKLDFLRDLFPSEYHRATYELGLDAVICKHLLPEDDANWVGMVAAGETQDGKTLIAYAVCWTLGLERRKISFDLSQAKPGSLGVRLFSKGRGRQGVKAPEAFSFPFIILEELDKVTDRNVLRNVRHLLQGERILNVEGTLIEIRAVPFILFNLQKEEGLKTIENRLRQEYLRRSVVLNTAALSLDVEEISQWGARIVKLQEEGKFPRLDLSRLEKPSKLTGKQKDTISKLLFSRVLENEKKLIDVARVVHLVQGRIARHPGLGTEEVICSTLYDYLLTRESLGVTRPGWREGFWGEKEAGPEEPEQLKKIKGARGKAFEPEMSVSDQIVEEVKDEWQLILNFDLKYKKLLDGLRELTKMFKKMREEQWGGLFSEKETQELDTIPNLLEPLQVRFGKIKRGDWGKLEAFESLMEKFLEDHLVPLFTELKIKSEERAKKQEAEKQRWMQSPLSFTPQEKKSQMSTEDKLILGIGVGIISVEQSIEKLINYFASKKASQRSDKPTRSVIPHPPQRTTVQREPIGRAKLFHSTLHRWVEAEIWEKKYDSLVGKEKYYVTWEDDRKRSGWVLSTQLNQIFYFGQQN